MEDGLKKNIIDLQMQLFYMEMIGKKFKNMWLQEQVHKLDLMHKNF